MRLNVRNLLKGQIVAAPKVRPPTISTLTSAVDDRRLVDYQQGDRRSCSLGKRRSICGDQDVGCDGG